MKFRSDIAGYITGVRFYKGAGNTGTHVGHLWTASGTLLATATFTAETASGWQQVDFAQPVQIQANTTYVASYFAPNGHYAFNSAYFASAGVDSGVLHALSNAAAGGNGVFLVGLVGLPDQLLQFDQLLGRCRLQQHPGARHHRQDAGARRHGA